jgi:hypothetical protein
VEDEGVGPDRAELLALRARVAVLERVAWLGVVMSAQLKRGSTLAYLEAKRAEYAENLADGSAAPEMSQAERDYLGARADGLFRRIIAAVEEV